MPRRTNQDRKSIPVDWSLSEKHDAAFHGTYFTRDRGAALNLAILRKLAKVTQDVALTKKCGALLVTAELETLRILSETIQYVESSSSYHPDTGITFDFTSEQVADAHHWLIQAAYYECKNDKIDLTIANVLKYAARVDHQGLDTTTVTRVLKAAGLPHAKGKMGRPRKSDNN